MLGSSELETAEAPTEANGYCQQHMLLLLDSFERLLGRPLLAGVERADWGRQAYLADFALLSHNTAADPLFNYANRTGLDLFELNWQELLATPSRLSAEPVNRQERERLLAAVTSKGFIDDYAGVRISKNGRRFRIEGAVVWNVYDSEGSYYGQAACFDRWIRLD